MIKSFIGPFLLTFSISMIVLILNFVWLYIDELVGKGLNWNIILELLGYLSASRIPLAIIMGILLASIMTFGNLGEHNELTAIKSAGISLYRIMLPVFAVVSILALISLFLSNYAIPVYNFKFASLLRDIHMQRPEFDVRKGQFYNGLESYSLKIGDRSKDGMTLYDLMIYDHSKKKGNIALTMADSGYMNISENKEHLILNLFDGSSYEELLSDENNIQQNKPFRQTTFSNQKVIIGLPGSELARTSQGKNANVYRMLNMQQLRDTVNGLNEYMIWQRNSLGHKLLEHDYLKLENKQENRDKPDYYAYPDTETDPYTIIKDLPTDTQREIFLLAQSFARSVQKDLNESYETIKSRKQYHNMFWNEWNRMPVNALACLVFFIIGAPLGALIRRGGMGAPLVVSVLLFLAYYMLSNWGEKLARADLLPSWAGMWGSFILLIPIGLILAIKSNEDSKIFRQNKNPIAGQSFEQKSRSSSAK